MCVETKERLRQVHRAVSSAVDVALLRGGVPDAELIVMAVDVGFDNRVTEDEAIEVLGFSGFGINEIAKVMKE
jgi:hypothetical protein